MADTRGEFWTTVVSRGASKLVITPKFPSKRNNGNSSEMMLNATVIYQDEDLKDQLLARKATALVQQALTPGSVLFCFPANLFKDRTEAYDEIVEQCGNVVGDGGLRTISEYGKRSSCTNTAIDLDTDFDTTTIGSLSLLVCHRGRFS